MSEGDEDESSDMNKLQPCDGACKMVKYCSATCQKRHRRRHIKECMKRVADMQEEEQLFEKITDESLFKQPPLLEDCPICMLPVPAEESGRRNQFCCGKVICSGCEHAFKSRITKEEHDVCPFCRSPPPTMDIMMKRMEKGDANAATTFRMVGCFYQDGQRGFPVDYKRLLSCGERPRNWVVWRHTIISAKPICMDKALKRTKERQDFMENWRLLAVIRLHATILANRPYVVGSYLVCIQVMLIGLWH